MGTTAAILLQYLQHLLLVLFQAYLIYINFIFLYSCIKKANEDEAKQIGMEEIQTDIHNIEEDVKKINCSAIYDLIVHTIKCMKDFISCWCKPKTS